MKAATVSRLLMFLLLALTPAALVASDGVKSAAQEEKSLNPENIGRALRDLFDRWRESFGFATAREERPLISMMLRNRERLKLSAEQVKRLEQLRDEFAKESIRSDADLRIAEMDLNSLLEAQPVDMAKIEAKIREIERTRADLRIARIRAMEKGKEQLSADQRSKLRDLLADQNLTRINLRPTNDSDTVVR